MKFLIDNALSPSIAYGLVEKGHDALHVRDVGLAAASDLEIIDLATQRDRILISADTDFGAILAFRESTKPSFMTCGSGAGSGFFRSSCVRPNFFIIAGLYDSFIS